ncbi:MAG: DUF2948 family protein [Alphaproteobacteria bacterium]|nr:DUF2948 family protein [Alphaproteobacteria bacterium]
MAPDDGIVLKLRAEDGEDLAVVSACLQDALVPVRDFAYVPQDRAFVFVANRFRWESGLQPAPGETGFQRILCGITFREVTAVSYFGFRRSEGGRILSLLAIRPENGIIHLEFSGAAAIRLKVARIFCHAKDIGEPWPTPWQPRHDVDERA